MSSLDQPVGHRLYSLAVVTLGMAFFARAGLNILNAHGRSGSLGSFLSGSTSTSRSSDSSEHQAAVKVKQSKPTSDSAVQVSYAATLDMCDARADAPGQYFVRAGALLKLIDIVAGVSARRHASCNCVTISVDAVVLLAPIPVSALVHLSASVNRAWSSSMEVGVRVISEHKGRKAYVSHSYLTFVALPSVQGGPKPVLANVQPRTTLEARRHLLAGRRRHKRLEDTKKGDARDGVREEVKKRMREEIAALLGVREEATGTALSQGGEQHADRIELEFVTRAWAARDPGVSLDGDIVTVNLSGDAPLQRSKQAVQSLARELGLRRSSEINLSESRKDPGWTFDEPQSISTVSKANNAAHEDEAIPSSTADDYFDSFRNAGGSQSRQGSFALVSSQPQTILVAETLSRSLHLVFPEHTNSQNRLFGGQTMAWMESCALNSARSLGVDAWSTVSVDGLEFREAVRVGEIMTLQAVVIRTFSASAELYVQAQAESQTGSLRWTNDALFVVTCGPSASKFPDPSQGRSSILPRVVHPPGSALEDFAKPSDARRASRLELRDMLRKVYS